MNEKKFCERCGQRIIEKPEGMIGLFAKKPMEFFEFKDGFYCEQCAKKKVEESRK